MSSQRGNVNRTRPQKHQNKKVFKNDLYDTNIRTKRVNQILITQVCEKCKAILEWKIKYKKYKLLKAPRSCNKCGEKSVKQSYHTVCRSCANVLSICPKCGENINDEIKEQNLKYNDLSDKDIEEKSRRDKDDFNNSKDDCTNKISSMKLNS